MKKLSWLLSFFSLMAAAQEVDVPLPVLLRDSTAGDEALVESTRSLGFLFSIDQSKELSVAEGALRSKTFENSKLPRLDIEYAPVILWQMPPLSLNLLADLGLKIRERADSSSQKLFELPLMLGFEGRIESTEHWKFVGSFVLGPSLYWMSSAADFDSQDGWGLAILSQLGAIYAWKNYEFKISGLLSRSEIEDQSRWTLGGGLGFRVLL